MCARVFLKSDDLAVQWQMNLYKDVVVVGSEEHADPEQTVDRIQSISAAVFHLEQVPYSQQLPFYKVCCLLRDYMIFPLRRMSLLQGCPVYKHSIKYKVQNKDLVIQL